MPLIKHSFFALCLFGGMGNFAYAQFNNAELRGELLYATHCSACHTYEVHWRKQKLATDWSSLVTQVRRWQASVGLGWSDEEISDVAHYLNSAHYGFQEPLSKGVSKGSKVDHFLHQ
jgi:mono/diheme cytochrome c family protein